MNAKEKAIVTGRKHGKSVFIRNSVKAITLITILSSVTIPLCVEGGENGDGGSGGSGGSGGDSKRSEKIA